MDVANLVLKDFIEMLSLTDSETKDYIAQLETNKEIARILDVGVSVIKRVELTRDVEYIKKEAKAIASNFEKSTHANIEFLSGQLSELVSKNFDPNKDSSYLKLTVDHLRKELETFKTGVSSSVKLMIENAEKVSTDKLEDVEKSLDDIGEKLNPDLETSYLGKMKSTVKGVQTEIGNMLDNSQIGSFAYNLEEELGRYFGEKSPILVDVQKIVSAFTELVNISIISLREEIAKKSGEEEAMKKSAIKGFTFEEEVEDVISQYASNKSEVYVNTAKVSQTSGTSKKGDFVYEFEDGNRTVIEAKDKIYNGVKPTLKYLDEAMETRSCDYAILVVANIEQLPKNSLGFNIYEGNKMMCVLPFLPYAMQFLRMYIEAKNTDSLELNPDVIVNGVERIQNQVKNFVTMKSKLTSLSNNTVNSVNEIKSLLDGVHEEINSVLGDINLELKK